MMIFLFSQSIAVLAAFEAFTALFMTTRIYDGASLPSVLAVLLIGSLIAWIAAGFYAGLIHQRLLLLLYSLMRPEDFIRLYEPLLSRKWVPSNVRFTLTAYLSNGYAAKGDFAHARALLDHMPETAKRQKLKSDLILCGNRANIALLEGSAQEAERQLALMKAWIESGKLQTKQKEAQETILRVQTAQLHILSKSCITTDCEILRDESRKPCSALRKTELNYFIGSAYALLSQPGFAREYLIEAAQNKAILCGRLAESALKRLYSSDIKEN